MTDDLNDMLRGDRAPKVRSFKCPLTDSLCEKAGCKKSFCLLDGELDRRQGKYLLHTNTWERHWEKLAAKETGAARRRREQGSPSPPPRKFILRRPS